MFQDETGYDAHYAARRTADYQSLDDFVSMFETHFLQSFPNGGWVFDGKALAKAIGAIREDHPSGSRVLDCGCGTGQTSMYLSHLGYSVTGVEISREGVNKARTQRDRLGLPTRFRTASLADTRLPDHSIDIFFGRNTLHHFIKYPGVAQEFRRLARSGATGYFVDPWSENVLRNRLLHTRRKREIMERLGDVLLDARLVREFFDEEQVEFTPVAWFAMLDKACMRLSKKAFGDWRYQGLVRRIARVTDFLDENMPHNRTTLWLTGTVVTRVSY